MPYKAGKPCKHTGCPNTTHRQYCYEHEKQNARPSATAQGYNYRWQKESKRYLRKHPLCVYCQRNNRLTPATVVDHIIPHKGKESLFWNKTNWQALCKPCHDSKTATEDGGFGRNVEYQYNNPPEA